MWPIHYNWFGTTVDLFHIVTFLAAAIGVSVSILLLRKRVGRGTLLLPVVVLTGGVYGSRVLGGIVYDSAPLFSNVWQHALARGSSISILGAIVGGLLVGAGWIYARRLPLWDSLASLMPGLAVAQALGRWGCLAVGCCIGRPTTLPWAVRYPPLTRPWFQTRGLGVHPVQVYESIGSIVIAALLLLLWRRGRHRLVVGTYFVGQGVSRLLLEFIRVGNGRLLLGMSAAQWLSLTFIVSGSLILLRAFQSRSALVKPQTA